MMLPGRNINITLTRPKALRRQSMLLSLQLRCWYIRRQLSPWQRAPCVLLAARSGCVRGVSCSPALFPPPWQVFGFSLFIVSLYFIELSKLFSSDRPFFGTSFFYLTIYGVLFRECFWVINVEAHAAHCRMASKITNKDLYLYTSKYHTYEYQYYNEARERSEPFFPWFSKEKITSS